MFQAIDMAGANIAHGAQVTFPIVKLKSFITLFHKITINACLQGSGPRIVNANSRSLSLAR